MSVPLKHLTYVEYPNTFRSLWRVPRSVQVITRFVFDWIDPPDSIEIRFGETRARTFAPTKEYEFRLYPAFDVDFFTPIDVHANGGSGFLAGVDTEDINPSEIETHAFIFWIDNDEVIAGKKGGHAVFDSRVFPNIREFYGSKVAVDCLMGMKEQNVLDPDREAPE